MPNVAELLKAAGIKDEVVAGLPKEVAAALEGIASQAETTLTAAQKEKLAADEARRQAELDRAEITRTVESYGDSLTKQGSLEAENKALKTYLESLKTQGFDVTLPTVDGAKPAVPGSPAIGGNVDATKITAQVRGEVGAIFSQYLDANNEHIRLYGVPIPDSSENIAYEAARARKPVGEYISEKYNFKAKQTEKQQAEFQKKVDDAVKVKVDETLRVEAEKRGSNPNLRPGESSRASHIPKVNPEQFHKADGNVPRRERERRMLENLHKDVAEIRSVA
jgi:hypothetical protein